LPVAVLFYHRIADDRATPWTTSNRSFQRQIQWLARRFDLVSLEEAQRRIRAGNRRACVAVTFDDGYAENLHKAIPLLIENGIPCTYFVTLRNLTTNEPFPHDRELGHRFLPNTLEQIRMMVRSGIEIGAHTHSHPDLGRVPEEDELRAEIIDARQELQSLTESPIRYFAFPYGQHANLTARAFRLAKEAGYDGVCSAYGGYNVPGGDVFHLERIHGDEELIRIKNWTTIDPRMARTPPFQYLDHGAAETLECTEDEQPCHCALSE
jgi:peptidoglycan/xylan/chitin deacetylase (PgdA/CDA1 family)